MGKTDSDEGGYSRAPKKTFWRGREFRSVNQAAIFEKVSCTTMLRWLAMGLTEPPKGRGGIATLWRGHVYKTRNEAAKPRRGFRRPS